MAIASFQQRIPRIRNWLPGLSVREDYTVAERNIKKEYATKAKLKNDEKEDPNYEWKVRGSPRNGIKLIRFLKLTKMDQKDDGLFGNLQKSAATFNQADKQQFKKL